MASVQSPARVAIYPGSFDPVTRGHADVARRALHDCDRLIVAVGHNRSKTPTFEVNERLAMLRQEFANEPRVEVDHFDGWLVAYAQHRGASSIVRGLRDSGDWLSEAVMMGVNFCLGLGLRTQFIQASPEHAQTSSTRARQVARQGGDLTGLVSPHVQARLQERLGHSSS